MRLNLGCGKITHPDWVNVDFKACVPEAVSLDLSKPLPFPEGSAECIYASHLLEHFPKRQAPLFVAECLRVLKPGGRLRLVVPDLEALARHYLGFLERAMDGDDAAGQRYDWIMLELFDQIVRTRSGGEMAVHWSQSPMPAEDFVLERAGGEVRDFLDAFRNTGQVHPNVALLDKPDEPSDEAEYLRLRASGELHRWMYDRYSLGRLMRQAGFQQVEVCFWDESGIHGFAAAGFDSRDGASPRKPDSLYMEGVKFQPHAAPR